MSLVYRTICAFPRGRSLELIHALVGTSFGSDERLAILAELDELASKGLVRRRTDGLWVPQVVPAAPRSPAARAEGAAAALGPEPKDEALVAAPFRASNRPTPNPQELPAEAKNAAPIDPAALLRYWRSALRADPRGATEGLPDRHGIVWHLIAGPGPLVPSADQARVLSVPLDALLPEFRTALIRREANENTLAIGWPLAVGRKLGVPVIWPVGLVVAEWQRVGDHLEITVSTDDVLVNPSWLKGAARGAGWSEGELRDLLSGEDGVGLPSADFLRTLRDAAARQMRGALNGERLVGQISPGSTGLYDAAALFLPEDSSFTAGAVRDLDRIATWGASTLSQTALAPFLGLPADLRPEETAAVNLSDLNAEQIEAVDAACRYPLTVVTGPPGTGKSQTIVAMAASVLQDGGSVLVASRNHQALDAVEDRLGGIAPDLPFVVRTLHPGRDVDRNFRSVLDEVLSATGGPLAPLDGQSVARLRQAVSERSRDMTVAMRWRDLQFEIAEVHEAREEPSVPVTAPRGGFISRIRGWLFRRPIKTRKPEPPLARLRAERDALPRPGDPVEQSRTIAELARKVLPGLLAARCAPKGEEREALDRDLANHRLAARDGAPLPRDLAEAVLRHRPLWLASILGTPGRIPLEAGLFDLVIFDEASQCDIASALPLLARARRSVVVGDDRQLTFIPQLRLAQDRNLMQAQGLPVARMGQHAQSRQSLFRFAQSRPCARRIQLKKQYRSAGPIVDYINDNFYDRSLQAAHDPRTLKVPANGRPGLAWTHVPASRVSGEGNVNRAEVAAIADHVVLLLEQEGYGGTIGVTTPFRAQADAIGREVAARIRADRLAAAEFLSATVDGFQGQERDLILFSPSLGATSPQSALTFVQKESRRLNVAISRARAVAHVMGDLEFARSGRIKTLQTLAAYATEPRARVNPKTFGSHWERIVFHGLVARGLSPTPQYEITGRRLDFALFGEGGIKLDLEVDGRLWHETTDGLRKPDDIWRDHLLKSLGWRVRRFWVDELAKDLEACLDIVERDLSALEGP